MPSRRRQPLDARAVLALAGLGASGAAGLLPAVGGAPDPHALLAWLALIAPAAGFLCGALRIPFFPEATFVPGAWMLALGSAESLAERDLAGPVWAALAISGLWALGYAAGTLFPGRAAQGAGALLLATALLAGLPGRAGLTRVTWSERAPALGARLFDLSPVTLVLECAGVDWERQPAAYASAGTDWFSGRRAWRGSLAGPVLLVLGCLSSAAALGSVRIRRARRASAGPGGDAASRSE